MWWLSKMDKSVRLFETIFLMNTYVFTSGSSLFVFYINKALNIRVLYRAW